MRTPNPDFMWWEFFAVLCIGVFVLLVYLLVAMEIDIRRGRRKR